jgi:uncharacterized YigZ family protein
MLFSSTYKMIDSSCECLYKAKGSKFFAYAWPVKTEAEIKNHLNEIKDKYPDATHHCFAWILGYDKQNFRANDDGEPSNTAGKPILRQIQRLDLCNTLVIVVRYFGGTMLGVPGLIEAYGNAAAECLALAKITEYPILEKYIVSCPFGIENEVFKACKQFQASLTVLAEESCFSAEIKIPLHKAGEFKNHLALNYQINIEYKGIE